MFYHRSRTWPVWAWSAFLLTGCAPPADRSGEAGLSDPSQYRGALVEPPYVKIAFTLTDQRGQRFDFGAATEGFVTLLFFGYTHCPDICPVHMTNIAAALRRLTPTQARQIKVVFVTTDPRRDTPERLAEWLGAIDPSFIGLTGSADDINEILRAFQMPEIDEQPSGEQYDVVHAAHVIAYGKDDLGHLIYPFGIRQADWVHDLPLLVDEG